jgi:hypothetical protein
LLLLLFTTTFTRLFSLDSFWRQILCHRLSRRG